MEAEINKILSITANLFMNINKKLIIIHAHLEPSSEFTFAVSLKFLSIEESLPFENRSKFSLKFIKKLESSEPKLKLALMFTDPNLR